MILIFLRVLDPSDVAGWWEGRTEYFPFFVGFFRNHLQEVGVDYLALRSSFNRTWGVAG
jgi:hypothetical protein